VEVGEPDLQGILIGKLLVKAESDVFGLVPSKSH
jgi:hypothetical protein